MVSNWPQSLFSFLPREPSDRQRGRDHDCDGKKICATHEPAWEKGKLRFYKSRIAGSDVEAATLSEAEYKKLLQTYPPVKKGEKRTHIGIRQACRRYRTKPLLILMPCLMYDKETDLKQKSISDHKLSDQVFMAYALSFCYFADPGSSREVKVLYKVNKTWFKEHLDDDDDGEDM